MVEPALTVAAMLAKKAVNTVVKSSLINAIRDGVVDFLISQAKDLGKKELADRIARLRSDAALQKQLRAATERAVARWAEDYPDVISSPLWLKIRHLLTCPR